MKKAFSLVELSVVVAIIAVIIAAVSLGSKVVESSKRQRFIAEITGDKANLSSFITTYNAYPGDIDNASSYWSGATNGNGDSIINGSTTEEQHYWNHLSLADIIILNDLQTANSGTTASVLTDAHAQQNIRKRAYNSSNYSNFFYSYKHVIFYGKAVDADDKAFIPTDAYLIDNKMDDGMPKTGDVTYKPAGSTTNASCVNNGETYYLTATTEGCNIVYYNRL